MCILKLSADSSYIPCLGSGAFGGSTSDSGSYSREKNNFYFSSTENIQHLFPVSHHSVIVT